VGAGGAPSSPGARRGSRKLLKREEEAREDSPLKVSATLTRRAVIGRNVDIDTFTRDEHGAGIWRGRERRLVLADSCSRRERSEAMRRSVAQDAFGVGDG